MSRFGRAARRAGGGHQPIGARRIVASFGAVALLAGLAALVPFSGASAASEPELLVVTYVNVGHGDAAIYRAPCGEVGIIDIPETRAGRVSYHLERQDYSNVAWIAASHYDIDHIGGIKDFLAFYQVGAVYDRGGGREEKPTQIYYDYYDAVTGPRNLRKVVSAGDVLTLCDGDDEVTFTIVSPNANGTVVGGIAAPHENDKSLCMKVTHADFDLATCGDISGVTNSVLRDVETPAAARIGDVEVVKANHHGFWQSSNQRWVNTLDPAVVVNTGPTNPQFPDPTVVDRWMATADMVRTDLDNNIAIAYRRGAIDFHVFSDSGTKSYPVDPPITPRSTSTTAASTTTTTAGGSTTTTQVGATTTTAPGATTTTAPGATTTTAPGGTTTTTSPLPPPQPPPSEPNQPGTPRSISSACNTAPEGGSGFGDVNPASSHTAAIRCIVDWLITTGTRPGFYDPGGDVTRAQMATFLVRLIENTGGRLPGSPRNAFPDDDASPHHTAINKLAAVGVVGGRADGTYGPQATVTRAQMATFIVRALELRAGASMSAGGDHFSDDERSVHEANINKAANEGITGGIGGSSYGPDLPVRRDQMASFLARGLAELVDREAVDI